MMRNGKTESQRFVVGLDGKRAVCNNTAWATTAAMPSTLCRRHIRAPCSGSIRLSTVTTTVCGPARPRQWELFAPSLKVGGGIDAPSGALRPALAASSATMLPYTHGLSNELPLTIKGVCPSVVTIHDLIYRRVPRDYAAIDRRLYDFKYRRSAKIATRVIAISECTKRDLMADYGIEEAKIDVIYQGVDPIFTLPVDTSARLGIKEKYKLPEKIYNQRRNGAVA